MIRQLMSGMEPAPVQEPNIPGDTYRTWRQSAGRIIAELEEQRAQEQRQNAVRRVIPIRPAGCGQTTAYQAAGMASTNPGQIQVMPLWDRKAAS
jgi:hypothetical protein